jgi:hypothetical protein
MKLNYGTALLTSAMILLGASSARAETGFAAYLDGLQESPPNASPATGTAVMVLNNAQTELTYQISFSGLVGTQTAAHFHHNDIGNPSPNGAVVRGIGVGSPIAGVWKNTDAEPLTPFLVGELIAGRIYINVHSTVYPGGEIRGNIYLEPTPTENTTWSRVKAMYSDVAGE